MLGTYDRSPVPLGLGLKHGPVTRRELHIAQESLESITLVKVIQPVCAGERGTAQQAASAAAAG